MDLITARLQTYPDAHIYHYASYEETALKRLAMVHGTREAQLDDLLRGRKLVDLYKVVREAVRISEAGYSLKNIEVFFGGDRAGDVKTALDSMVFYDQWQQTGDHVCSIRSWRTTRRIADRSWPVAIGCCRYGHLRSHGSGRSVLPVPTQQMPIRLEERSAKKPRNATPHW